MTSELSRCPTCERRPSERIGMAQPYGHVGSQPNTGVFASKPCADPFHDLADLAPELKAQRDELHSLLHEIAWGVIDTDEEGADVKLEDLCPDWHERARAACIRVK